MIFIYDFCFYVLFRTLDNRPPITCDMPTFKPTIKIATDDMPRCFDAKLSLVINSKDFSEALGFYKAALGAEVQFQNKRKRGDRIDPETVLKIGAQTYIIFNSHES